VHRSGGLGEVDRDLMLEAALADEPEQALQLEDPLLAEVGRYLPQPVVGQHAAVRAPS